MSEISTSDKDNSKWPFFCPISHQAHRLVAPKRRSRRRRLKLKGVRARAKGRGQRKIKKKRRVGMSEASCYLRTGTAGGTLNRKSGSRLRCRLISKMKLRTSMKTKSLISSKKRRRRKRRKSFDESRSESEWQAEI